MVNCAIYPRKSKQVDNSDSMEVQLDMCIRYLDGKYGKGNYTVTIYDKDYGITGHEFRRRKDFQRMMQDVAEGKIQLVVIQRYDRIARNTRDFCNLFYDMETKGCNLVSVSQQIDTTTPYGRKFMYDQASNAELEWALNSERRKDANRYARSIGKCTLPNHCIPFGYKVQKIDGIRRMVKNENTEDATNDLIDYYEMHRNYCGTAKYINDKYGLKMSNNSIKKIVHSTYLYGAYRENPNFCEPYMTKERWDKLQIKRPVIRNDSKKKTEILFSGMIRCPECGRLMRSCQKSHRNGKVFRYFHCEYHTTRLCSYSKVKSELLLEEMLITYIHNYISNLDMSVRENEEKKKAFVDKEKKYKQELERLNTMFLKGRITEEYYDAEYLRLNELISQNLAITASEGHSKPLQDIFFENWTEVYRSLDRLHQKLFWRDCIKEIIVNKNMEVTDVIFL